MANGTHSLVHEHDATMLTVGSGSLAEGITGLGAAILCILGLAGIMSGSLLSIATIAVGAALLFQGMAITAKFSRIANQSQEVHTPVALGTGTSAQSMGGIAGIVLGILALIGIGPQYLTAIAAIVFGMALVLGSAVNMRLNALEMAGSNEHARRIAHEAVTASTDLQVIIGLAAITLGILAVINIAPQVLTLVAMLSVGVADFFSGSALAGKMFGSVHHE